VVQKRVTLTLSRKKIGYLEKVLHYLGFNKCIYSSLDRRQMWGKGHFRKRKNIYNNIAA
jgi:hypothetical protein